MNGRYNTRSPAVKRLMREAQELSEPTDQYFAQPLDDNLFEWHFTIRGPADSDFQNGIYHGRIILPVDYPMKPPSIIWLTPNGRFETCKKICLSISGHHPESWQPSWSIRTALLAIIGFMPTHPGGAIGSLDYTPEERKVLAKKSKDWKCPTCGEITGILLNVSANTQATSNEAKELAAQINLQGEKPKCKDGECPVEQARLADEQSEAASLSNVAQENGAASTKNSGAIEENAANNTSTNVQGPQASTLPFPAANQQAFPLFPQWSPYANAFPVPPLGFPFPHPGMPPMAPMQFPYPPSHYSGIPQYPWQPIPSNMAMQPPPTVSVNNSSNQEHHTGTNFSSNKNDKYSRSPMVSPITTTTIPQPVTTAPASNAANVNREQSDDKGNETIKNNKDEVCKELLSKINRVGSNPDTNKQNAETVATTSGKQEQSIPGASKLASKQKRSDPVGKRPKNDDGTDSELSAKSLKKSKGKSLSEMGDTNTEDNSESDVPPIEADQGPGLEKGACSSTSDLERWKQRYQIAKGLRQRQSATANVSSDLTEEGAPPEAERSETNAARQRIEAVSGDTGSRNRSRHATRLGNNVNLGNRADNGGQNRQGSYDVGFYLMVGLFTTSMLILLNRLVAIEWSGL